MQKMRSRWGKVAIKKGPERVISSKSFILEIYFFVAGAGIEPATS